jgi:hypothetical protein
MKRTFFHTAHILTVFLCLTLLLFLTACEEIAPAVNPNATPTSTAWPGYRGNGYALVYPRDWQLAEESDTTTYIKDPPSTVLIQIVTGDDDGTTLDQGLNLIYNATIKNLDNAQESEPKTINISQWPWTKRDYAGKNTGHTQIKGAVLATKFDARVFIIIYSVTAEKYDSLFSKYIQPSIASFQFTGEYLPTPVPTEDTSGTPSPDDPTASQ